MSTTTPPPLVAVLKQAGISTPVADVLAAYYPTADLRAFVTGLDWLTQTTRTLVLPTTPMPTEPPWHELAQAMQTTPAAGDLMDAVLTTLSTWAPDLQSALCEALNERDIYLSRQPVGKRGKRNPHSTEYLKALATLGYTFRMNDLNDVVEVNATPISDGLRAQIRKQMRDQGFEYVNVMEDCYVAEAYLQRYQPVRQYLNSLTWDGDNHIAKLAAHIIDKEGVFPLFLRRWLIGAVAKACTYAQNAMLVLEGPQNLGKSYLAEWLGTACRRELYFEGAINPEDKDDKIRLASKWVWEVNELGATQRRADREALKAFLTQGTVTVRKAYDRFDMIKPALASFIGTVNNEGGFLNDPTGSRRFMVAALTTIDWSYSATLDRQQIWAEANAAYLAGETWKLTPDEYQLSEQINRGYEMDDPIESLLLKYFWVEPSNTLQWTSSMEILLTLEANGLRGGQTRANAMALGGVMAKLGVERKKRDNGHGQRVWCFTGVWPI